VIAGIVLAAGTSSRMGRPKQLLPVEGKPILQMVVERALEGPLDEVMVVLGHRAEEIGTVVPVHRRVRTVLNARYADGLSTSLDAGLHSATQDTEAAVVLLGDQPGVRPDAIAAVVDAFQRTGARAVQAGYGGRPAHPTLLARSIWPEVTADLTGDAGAQAALRRHPDWRSLVEVGGRPPADVDTDEDYRRLQRSLLGGVR
jgi:molybdenum cofactor cytidylyltransferase